MKTFLIIYSISFVATIIMGIIQHRLAEDEPYSIYPEKERIEYNTAFYSCIPLFNTFYLLMNLVFGILCFLSRDKQPSPKHRP